ncbi:MAG: hypothetical protein H0X45_04975, partial [Planctomycetes bacterium]|nr:hypothetical protein [Planctomycetota bacterium]
MVPRPVLVVALLAACSALIADDADGDAEGQAFFESRIRPVLIDHCYRCHSAESEHLKGGLRVDTRDGLLSGGDSGPAIVPGDAGRSLLVTAVRWHDEDLQMPPKQALPPAMIDDLVAWVG